MDTTFYVPENLYILGMMNTADRSLAVIDYALRRRFAFVRLLPQFTTPGFRNSLIQAGAPDLLVTKIISRISKLNSDIADDRVNLGTGYMIGHSYFCPPRNAIPDEVWYEQVIETEVIPLLTEYWFDDPSKVGNARAMLLAK